MSRIAVGGFQHETNTFAPTKAGYPAFEAGGGWPGVQYGEAIFPAVEGANIPAAGAIQALRAMGHTLVGTAWAAASPSAHVTAEAFERILGGLLQNLQAAGKVDGVYLDLHGAMVSEEFEDGEGEILRRVRDAVGPRVPIVASLDLHANVTRTMVNTVDAMVAYRTYPHVDMADTGARAARLLEQMLKTGQRLTGEFHTLDYLTGISSQCSFIEPCKSIYTELGKLEDTSGCILSFTPGFPMADFEECGMSVFGYGLKENDTKAAVAKLRRIVADAEKDFALELHAAGDAVRRARERGAPGKPVVLADTQDNPGAGGDSNTTGMLHALLAQGAGRRFPGQVALGLMFDAEAGRAACAAGVGATLDLALGRAVPTFTGQASDPPLRGRFTVRAVSDGRVTLKGPMMTGLTVALGPSACLEIEGVRVAVVGGKKQLMDRELLRMVGIQPEQQRIIVVKSSNHFRADFTPIASRILVAKAAGPMAAEPADLPWKHLPADIRRTP